jgi:hypothetical protein
VGLLAVLGIMVVATLGAASRWRPIRGEAGRRVTQLLLVLAAVSMLATIGVVALIVSSR